MGALHGFDGGSAYMGGCLLLQGIELNHIPGLIAEQNHRNSGGTAGLI